MWKTHRPRKETQIYFENWQVMFLISLTGTIYDSDVFSGVLKMQSLKRLPIKFSLFSFHVPILSEE